MLPREEKRGSLLFPSPPCEEYGVPCLGFGASRGRYGAARFFQVVKIISELGSGREDDEGKLGRSEDAQLLSEVPRTVLN